MSNTSLAAVFRAALAGAILVGASAHAAPIGDVEVVRGAGAAQRGTEAPRVLGSGTQIEQGEVVTTGANSFAVIKLNDGTRMTLRPNTSMKIDDYVLDQPGKSDNMVLNLLKGGLRVVTGVISKRASTSRLVTTTATVGIRGTDFDARICGEDCKAEGRRPLTPLAQANASTVLPASARVVQMQGGLTAVSESGERRLVTVGGPAFRGDTLETPAGATAVLAFRDDTRITVQGGTRIRIEDYTYDARAPAEGRFSLGLITGGIRALTGLIAKAKPSSVRFTTSTATVGIRGTGLDMNCSGGGGQQGPGAVADNCFVSTWQGTVTVSSAANPGVEVVVPAGSTAQVTPANPNAVMSPEIPAFMRDNPAPRPDTINVDTERLFGSSRQADSEPGLYVNLRDGHLAIEAGGRTLDIARGEAVFADASGRTLVRLDAVPSFIQNDATPRPDRVDARGVQLLDMQALGMRTRAALVCRP